MGRILSGFPAGNPIWRNFSVASVTGFAADTYLSGSYIRFPAPPKAGTVYRLLFDVSKTAAGTATPIITVRVGTAGATTDAAILTFTFGAGTAAADNGTVEVYVMFRTVGSGTGAVVVGAVSMITNQTSTGLSTSVKERTVISSGFDSTVSGLGIGVSYNGGASASHTVNLVSAELAA